MSKQQYYKQIKKPKPPKFIEVFHPKVGGGPKMIAVKSITLVCENNFDGGTDIWLHSAKFEDERSYSQICQLLCADSRSLTSDTSTEPTEVKP